jgi:hypothetical protein
MNCAALLDGTHLNAVLVVVVDWNCDDLTAAGLIVWIVELRYVGVPQCLSSADALVGVELQANHSSRHSVGTAAEGRESKGADNMSTEAAALTSTLLHAHACTSANEDATPTRNWLLMNCPRTSTRH